MPDVLWRLVESRLRRRLPAARAESTIGDLVEDYAHRRTTGGPITSRLWLLREARSLTTAYRMAAASSDPGPRATGAALTDVRHAYRRIRTRPAPALICAALLAVGIGLATTMFSVVDALLLRPAPFREAERLVTQGQWRALTPAVLDAWRGTEMFEAVEAAAATPFQFETSDQFVPGAWVTAGMLEMLDVHPVRGRTFTASDAGVEAGEALLISESLWRSTLGSDPDVVGRRLALGGSNAVIVGVMPDAFRFPAPTTAAWRVMDAAAPPAAARMLWIYARLKPGVPRVDAQVRVGAIAHDLGRLPRNYRGNPPLTSLDASRVSAFTRQALWCLLAGVGLLFVGLCANVSGLVLTRLSARRRELGVCRALGASRAGLIREAAIEHVAIGIAGSAAGIVLTHNFVALIPDLFVGRTLNPIDLDPRALIAASALGIVAVLLSGVMPAWLGTRAEPLESIRATRRTGTEARGVRMTSRALLTAEIALACSLLAASTLLVRSFVNLVHADRGLDLGGITHVHVTGLRDAFPSLDAMAIGVRALADNVQTWPEVADVAMSQEIPPEPGGGGGTVVVDDLRIESDGYRVSPAFFDLYRIPVRRGRTFGATSSDTDVVIGERLANLLWPNQDPVGRVLGIGRPSDARRVIGVVGEIALPTVDAALDRPEFYEPLHQEIGPLYLSLRCHHECPDIASIARRIQNVHSRLTPTFYEPENDYLTELRLPRAIAQVAGVFAIVAVMTAAGGLFSVLTYAVGRRCREFGIRTALGASPDDIRQIVIRNGFALAGAGVALGAGGGYVIARALSSFQYGVNATDALTWAAVIGTMTVTALAAAWRPAMHAMRLDPVKLLREE